MKNLIISLMLTLCVATLTAKGVYSENRTVGEFNSISFDLAGEVVVTTGNDFEVVVEGDQEYVYNVMTVVDQNTLYIKTENLTTDEFNNTGVKVYITMPKVKGLSVTGSGNISVQKTLVTDTFRSTISGSGNISLQEVYAKRGTCKISGSGSLNILSYGNVPKFRVRISGSGDFNAPEVEVEKLSANITGTGKCECDSNNEIAAITTDDQNTI